MQRFANLMCSFGLYAERFLPVLPYMKGARNLISTVIRIPTELMTEVTYLVNRKNFSGSDFA